MPIINIPPLREADAPRKYKLQARTEVGLESAIKRLEKAFTEGDTRRPRFPAVGEDIAHKIRR